MAAVMTAITLVGLGGIADSQQNADDEATRLASQFSRQLADTIRSNEEFQNAVATSAECNAELAALIVATYALEQAQAEYDIAVEALQECILGEEDPDPMPPPYPMPPPEVRPVDGEVSVLVQ